VVEYAESVTELVSEVVKQKKSFKQATADSSESLDTLHAKLKVKRAKPVFLTEEEEGTLRGPKTHAAVKAHQEAKFQAAKQRFSQRAKRAPKGAVVPDLSRFYVLEVPEETDSLAACAELRNDPHVRSCHPNYRAQAVEFLPSTIGPAPDDEFVTQDGASWRPAPWDSSYAALWGHQRIKALEAWDQFANPDTEPGAGIVVAVVDSGINFTHPDLVDNMWEDPADPSIHGWNFVAETSAVQDDYGHGTHVAGTIAAAGRNARGVIGVAPNAKLMAVKALDGGGYGDINWLADAILYATTKGADVINNSWGFASRIPEQPVLEAAVQAAHAAGAVVVFAAGNENGDDVVHYAPQNLPETIAVAAVTPGDLRAGFSNTGLLVDVAAPGVQILSTKSFYENGTTCSVSDTVAGASGQANDKYCHIQGTSMAAPHVSGLAALLLSKTPSLTNEDVRQILRVAAEPVGVAAQAAHAAGLEEPTIPPSGLLLFVGNPPDCAENTCYMYEQSDQTFAPLTIPVRAMAVADNAAWLQRSPYNQPYGSTFTVTQPNAATLEGTLTWVQRAPGVPVSFSSLYSCQTRYPITFSAGTTTSQQESRDIDIELVTCGDSRNAACPTAIDRPPFARGTSQGQSTYYGYSFSLYGSTGNGQPFTLNGSGSCDIAGAPLSYQWTYTGSSPAGVSEGSLNLQNLNQANASGTAPSVAVDTYLSFELAVTAGGQTSTTPVTLRVMADCFVATAAYGTPLAPQLDLLRAYRDDVLQRTPLGRAAIATYYRTSPPLARWIARKPLMRAMVRQVLKPVLRWASQQTGMERSSW